MLDQPLETLGGHQPVKDFLVPLWCLLAGEPQSFLLTDEDVWVVAGLVTTADSNITVSYWFMMRSSAETVKLTSFIITKDHT